MQAEQVVSCRGAKGGENVQMFKVGSDFEMAIKGLRSKWLLKF